MSENEFIEDKKVEEPDGDGQSGVLEEIPHTVLSDNTVEAGEPVDPAAELEKKLAASEQALKEEHDRFLRMYAEFENYKKRSAREMNDFRKFANEYLIRELLPMIDNLERALAGETHDAESLMKGVNLILKEMVRILDKFNVKPLDTLGKPFNPNFHEAVGQEESEEYGDNVVVREFQKGYLLHDRLIRPAMVLVSKKRVEPNILDGEELNKTPDETIHDEAQ
jgi:molecular chaperone GrpE